ncbi:MAG: type II secretion system protein N [Thiotrichales bacterium]
MKFSFKALALFFVALCVALIATVPARWALQFTKLPPGLVVSGVAGTVWAGTASAVRWRNLPEIALDWRIAPSRLLLGRLQADVRASNPGLQLAGTVTAFRDLSLRATDLTLDGDVQALPLPADAALVTPEGRLQARFDTLHWQGQRIEALAGIVHWRPARIAAPVRYELGELELKLNGNAGTINGQLAGRNGPIIPAGTLKLDPQGVLQTDIRLSPTAETPKDLRELLPMLGRQNADGSVTLKQTLPLVGIGVF